MKSPMQHQFARIPAPQIQRSVFDRTHGHKTAFDSAYLIPIYLDEILPGDTLNLKATAFARLSTLIFPIMDNIYLDLFFFFVPNRLLWSNWEKFQGSQVNPADSIDFVIPQIAAVEGSLSFTALTLADFFGLPVGRTILEGNLPSALPFRAYNLIWNEWFRDQNLQNSVSVPLGNGPDAIGTFSLLKRGKRHDYFTSCLPFPQKGPSVMLPLGSTAPVVGAPSLKGIGLTDGTQNFGLESLIATHTNLLEQSAYNQTVGTSPAAGAAAGATKVLGLSLNPATSGMVADLAAASAATINQLRQAYAFQMILENDARGGTRYVEMLKARWGVTAPDFRLHRPEYLGGCSEGVRIAPVAATAETTTELGDLAGKGEVVSQCSFSKSFVEHGYVIGLANVRSDITYQEGIDRMWSRRTRFDFYNPELAHLGEQAVLNQEIWNPAAQDALATQAFGYQERWAEYRYKPSFVTSLMRSDVAGTLHAWHLATDFGPTIPVLNSTFIQDAPPIKRVIAVNTRPDVIFDSYFAIRHARPMPVYSVPAQLGRF